MNVKQIILFILVFGFAGSSSVSAQEVSWNDSLNNIINSSLSDSGKVRELGAKVIYLVTNTRPEAKDFVRQMDKIVRKTKNWHLYAELYYSKAIVTGLNSDRKLLFNFIDSSLFYADKAGSIQFLLRGNRMKGQCYERYGMLDSASFYLKLAYEKCLLLKSPFESYRTLIALATLYERKSDWNTAVKYALDAASIAENNNMQTLASVYIRLGAIYQQLGDYESAFRYLEKAKEYSTLNQSSLLDAIYSNIGTVYQRKGELDNAITAFRKADSVMNVTGDYKEGFSLYSNMATIYTMKHLLDSAQVYFLKSISIAEASRQKFIGRTYLNYANFLEQKGAYAEQLEYANRAVQEIKKADDSEALSEALQVLASAYAKGKQYDNAVAAYQDALLVKDSVNNSLRNGELRDLMAKYESSKKENEIVRLYAEKRMQRLRLEKQEAIIAGDQLAAKQKQQEIDLLNQQGQINDLRLKQQKEALVLKELENETVARQLRITIQEKQIKESMLEREQNTQKIIIAGSVVGFVLLALGFFLYRERIRRKNDKERFQLERQLSDMKLEALQAQMNPHFVFNALNSINRFIVRNNSESASEYLIKFAKLIRMILENSRTSAITLQNEVEALSLYVEMEMMRFDNKFDFNIQIDEVLNRSQIYIPPLILQPFVENAIWHGLMNKKDKGAISIHVKPKGGDNLFIVIEDNGIGRDKAKENKSMFNKDRSYGMRITTDRIKAISGNQDSFRIIDLYDEFNNPAGTRIEIDLKTIAA